MTVRASHRSSWTDADIRLLRDGYAAGLTPRDLAATLGRTEEAVRRKYRLLERNGAYWEKRAAEERRSAAEAHDPKVRAVHEQMARRYVEVIDGTRTRVSREVK